MTTVRITARFSPSENNTIGRACWISRELVGRTIHETISGFEIHLTFADGSPSSEGAVNPQFLEAAVECETPDEGDNQLLQAAFSALREAATRLTDAIRFRQPSVSLAGETPQLQSLSVVDLDTGDELRNLPFAPNRGYPIAVGFPEFTVADAEEVLVEPIGMAETLLAQADYLARWTPHPKPGLAVLLTAVACESRVKGVLIERAAPDASALLDVLLRRPRVFQEPADQLFDHVARAVIGRSLREDDPDLWKELVSIFQVRNEMAHRGSEPTVGRAGELVWAGRRVFDWLETV